jgi:hypothetical protein
MQPRSAWHGDDRRVSGVIYTALTVSPRAQSYTEECIEQLLRLARKGKTEAVRLGGAVKELLDRGHGRPREETEATIHMTHEEELGVLERIAAEHSVSRDGQVLNGSAANVVLPPKKSRDKSQVEPADLSNETETLLCGRWRKVIPLAPE